MRTLTLKEGEERRIRRGHLWIYRDETVEKPGEYEPGETVTVLDFRKNPVGSAYVNPKSVIFGRLYSGHANQDLSLDFFTDRFKECKKRRKSLGIRKIGRMVHGEADFLPGLIVDRFDEILTVQHNTAGMNRQKETILEALDTVFSPRSVLSMDDTPSRSLEGLACERSFAGDELPEILWYEQDGLWWPLDLEGQKTGAYLDQVANRRLVTSYCSGKTVLDSFCYTGSFGMLAAKQGAKEVTLVDSSERALSIAEEAFERNKLLKPTIIKMNLLKLRTSPPEFKRAYDLVICDPPPLIRNRSRKKEGLQKYKGLFSLALEWVKSSGQLSLFSCSHHIQQADLVEQVKRASRSSSRRLLQLASMNASPDHPVLLTHQETEYLHGILLEVQ